MQEMWFYAGTERKAVGPCTREALLALRGNGRIQADTLVWKAGTEAWAPYADTELARAPAPPASPESSSLPEPVSLPQSSSSPEPSSLPEASGVADAVPEPVGVGGVPAAASTVGEAAPVVAVDNAYGVPSPRSFRRGGGSRRAGAGEPPEQAVDDDGWQYAKPVMWRRYFARMLDTIVLGSLVWFALATFLAAFVPDAYQALYGHVSLLNNPVSRTFLTFVVVIPVEAWILGMTGTTAGKWLFGVRVTHADGRAIGFLRALRREGRVFLQGLALGIPLFSMIAMIVAFIRLKDDGVAGWDAGKPWLVTARPPGVAQTWLFIVGVTFVIAAVVALQLLVAARKV
ncbi:MAG TPA: RDD family protein [Rhodanobacteraceae bacterium]|nr:RDD family protein [Rhodanobacteraceae bacterium]